ncbi:MAG: phytoene desaturase family protein [Bacteroidales bacterium]|jgi:phytoene desaturase|nr:phytoene desaturase family protein [Bacteroidales bacterium]
MSEEKNVVVIGAGIGGIATAAFLAKNGYSVSVFEKNSAPGGRCSNLVRDGHRFDLGATMLLMPGIYKEVFGALGLDIEKAFRLKSMKSLYSIYYDDDSVLHFSSDKGRMKEQLEAIEPGSYSASEKYVKKGYDIYLESMDKLVGRNFCNIFQFATPANIPLLFRIKAFTTHFSYARKYFSHPHLLMAYTFQNIYVGQSPFDSPALFSMVPAAELTEGSFFPEGGMFEIARVLIELATSYGVRFAYDTPVKSITVSGNRTEGIVLESGEQIRAGIVVANADLPYVYRKMLPGSVRSALINRMKYSCSAICFHWGLDKTYPSIGHHSVFLSDSFKKGLETIFRDKSVSNTPSFYLHAPSRSDPAAAPPNQDTLSVIVAAGHLDPEKPQDWEKLKAAAREAVLKRISRLAGENIENHIKFELAYTPETWEQACNISRGSVFGSLGHNIFQMGYFRPHNRHDRYHNLYFTGGSTHPGNGIPNVLLSAKLVSERIINNI